MALLRDVLVAALANLVFWIGLGVLFWGFGRRSRRQFGRFFGVQSGSILTVYLANASPDLPGVKNASSLVSAHEMRSIQTLSNLVNAGFNRLPDLVRGLVDGMFAGERPSLVAEVSPRDRNHSRGWLRLG